MPGAGDCGAVLWFASFVPAAPPGERTMGLRSFHPGNAEAFAFKQLANARDLLALNLNLTAFYRAATTARRTKLAAQFLNLRQRDVRREIMDHNHSLAAAMSRLAPQYHTPEFG